MDFNHFIKTVLLLFSLAVAFHRSAMDFEFLKLLASKWVGDGTNTLIDAVIIFEVCLKLTSGR